MRDLLIITGVIGVVVVLYAARAVIVPVLVGFVLAYVFNPLVTWARRRLKVPRWLSTAAILVIGIALILAFLIWIVPTVVSELISLLSNWRKYWELIKTSLPFDISHVLQDLRGAVRGEEAATTMPGDQPLPELPPAEATFNDAPSDPATLPSPDVAPEVISTQPAAEAAEPLALVLEEPGVGPQSEVNGTHPGLSALLMGNLGTLLARAGRVALPSLGFGVWLVGSAVSVLAYLTVAAVVIIFCFYFFTWRFNQLIGWFLDLIPNRHRERSLLVLGRIDASVSAIIRGRLMQASCIAIVTTVGWTIVGTPYSLLLGVAAGILNIVPYVAVITWPAAVLLTWADRATGGGGFSIVGVIILPSVVYFTGQLLDGWVIEPLVQGKATNLDPLSILLIVLIGGTLGGLLGLLLAIPTATCIKILAQEFLLPKLRYYALPPDKRPPGKPE